MAVIFYIKKIKQKQTKPLQCINDLKNILCWYLQK